MKQVHDLKNAVKRFRVARAAYRSLRATLVGRKEPQQVWNEGLREEVGFWERVFSGQTTVDAPFEERADPKAPIRDPLLRTLIGSIPGEAVSILDVGAGPMTSLGKTYPGKTLSITATDPLAPEYARLTREAGVEPPVRPIACRGEDLLSLFRPGSFDIAFARNALDHCYDPVRVITNMVHLVKEERFVVLRHVRREAQRQYYRNIHQWNFDIEGGELVIWRTRREKVHVGRVLNDAATLECFPEDEWVVCLITKRTGRTAEEPPPDVTRIMVARPTSPPASQSSRGSRPHPS